jgi:hypothetical protein
LSFNLIFEGAEACGIVGNLIRARHRREKNQNRTSDKCAPSAKHRGTPKVISA